VVEEVIEEEPTIADWAEKVLEISPETTKQEEFDTTMALNSIEEAINYFNFI